ncbi:MAG: DUF2141 domain-containing protein [Cellvibrionales bacterium]|nr:DUF2141 domain-containing protein [Cellvibrionales bacterium]
MVSAGGTPNAQNKHLNPPLSLRLGQAIIPHRIDEWDNGMKSFLAAITLAIQPLQLAQAADLSILIENITDPGGALSWSVFDSAETYKNDRSPVIEARSRVYAATTQVTLHDLPPGVYAVKVFHDANSNGKLDRNILGIPLEGYGFSNNKGRFGPPAFAKASVPLEGDTQIRIRLR